MALNKSSKTGSTPTDTTVESAVNPQQDVVIEQEQAQDNAHQETTPAQEGNESAEQKVEGSVQAQEVDTPGGELVETAVNTAISADPVVVKPAPQSSGVAAYAKAAENQGFEDVELGGFGTFPTVILGTDGKFECDDEDWGDTPFVGQLQKTKALYLCSQEGVEKGPCGFTYDQVNLNSVVDECTTVADLRKAWAEDGYTLSIKKYMEVVIEIVNEDSGYFGEFFIAKIAPASVNAFKGQLFIANNKHKTPLDQVKMQFSVAKRKQVGTAKFYPWKFKIIRD